MIRSTLSLTVVLAAALAACSSSTPAGFDTPAQTNDLDGGPAPSFGDAAPLQVEGELAGQVFAPNGDMPIAGALVYLTSRPPAEIPPTTYCDTCIELPAGTPYTTTDPRGEFKLKTQVGGPMYIVVQKGAFRRVRPLDVGTGAQDVPAALTRLPSRVDKALGDDVPRMAVLKTPKTPQYRGTHDHIDHALRKLGLEASALDMISDFEGFLSDPQAMSRYHIIFIPCRGDGSLTCDDPLPGNEAVQKNLRQFVEAGGKLYTTDYTYEFLRQAWPEPVRWQNQTAQIGSACGDQGWGGQGSVMDQGLADWLRVLGHGNMELTGNYVKIGDVKAIDAKDGAGKVQRVSPKVWAMAKDREGRGPYATTVSFPHGCGRVMYSTYETSREDPELKNPLTAQEKTLLYILLEVSVCVRPADLPR